MQEIYSYLQPKSQFDYQKLSIIKNTKLPDIVQDVPYMRSSPIIRILKRPSICRNRLQDVWFQGYIIAI